MNYKILSISILMIFCVFTQKSLFSQQETDNTIDGRYLVIDDFNTFFSHQDNTVVCESFELFNIKEDESSKPVHVAVSEMQNVIKFSIKSNSEKYENQRGCRLVMEKNDYLNTFRRVLNNMKVKYVIYQGELVTVDDFYLMTK